PRRYYLPLAFAALIDAGTVRPRAAPCARARGPLPSGMSNIAALDRKLNDAILSGKAMEAFDELYDEDVVMQENADPEYRGKAFNRKREEEFFATVEVWHGGEVLAAAVGDDVSFSEWKMDITLKGAGRVQMAQLAVR